MDDSSDKKDNGGSTPPSRSSDKSRSSKRSKEDHKANESTRRSRVDSSGEISSSTPGVVSETGSVEQDDKESKSRRRRASSGQSAVTSPGAYSSSHRASRGKDGDRLSKSQHSKKSGGSKDRSRSDDRASVSTPGACSSSRGSQSGKKGDRLTKSRHDGKVAESKERRKGGRTSDENSSSRQAREKRKAARNDQRNTVKGSNESSNGDPLLTATLVPDKEEADAANGDTSSPTVQNARNPPAGATRDRTQRNSTPEAPILHVGSSDEDWEETRARNGGRCYRAFWIAIFVLAIAAGVGAYFGLTGKDKSAPSILIYPRPSKDDCLSIRNGLDIDGQNELPSRYLEAVFIVVLSDGALGKLETIMEAIIGSMVADMTCCSDFGRRLSQASQSPIRGGTAENRRLLENKDCAVANAKSSIVDTSINEDGCTGNTTICRHNDTTSEGNQTVAVTTNLEFYLKGEEDTEFLVQAMGDALANGQERDFGLPPDLVLGTAVSAREFSASPTALTSAPTLTPSATPTKTPTASLSPSRIALVPTISPSAAPSAEEETATPSTKQTDSPSAAPLPGATPQPTRVATPLPTRGPTPLPTRGPTPQPTRVAAPQPTGGPSMRPTPSPTPGSSTTPTVKDAPEQSIAPTSRPSESPSTTPSDVPTNRATPPPTPSPTKPPTPAPTNLPSQSPSTLADARRAMLQGILSDHEPLEQQALDWLAETDTWAPDEGDANSDYLWLERYAMVALYFSTNGASWTENTNWLSSEPVCNWSFVHPSLDNSCPGPIKNLVLLGNNLQGSLPDVATKLSLLDTFYLNNNQITGTIPELGENSVMRAFLLSNNQITGSIPESIGNLRGLTNLALLNNQIVSTIPQSITSISSLQLLYLAGNSIGEIPTYITQLSSLRALDLESTGVTTIPSFLKNMPSLISLELGGNDIGGTFPSFLLEMTQLDAIVLQSTGMTGSIPEGIGGLSRLSNLNLGNNQMAGTLPAGLTTLSLLNRMYLSNNNFSGPLPPDWSKMTALQYVQLDRNSLTGSIPVLPDGPFGQCLLYANCFSDDANAVARGCSVNNSC